MKFLRTKHSGLHWLSAILFGVLLAAPVVGISADSDVWDKTFPLSDKVT